MGSDKTKANILSSIFHLLQIIDRIQAAFQFDFGGQ